MKKHHMRDRTNKRRFNIFYVFFVIVLTEVFSINIFAVDSNISTVFSMPQLIICIYALALLTMMLVCFIIFIIRYRKTENKTDNIWAIENKTENDKIQKLEESLVDNKAQEDIKPRFYMLSEIDKSMKLHYDNGFNNTISLNSICESFRDFAANKLKLYYDISDIRSFIAGMAVSHFILMQGMSGTGKTSLAYAFGEYLGNESVIIPIQPMWKESSDMIGYYNEFTNRFNETNMLKTLYVANYTKDMYIVVLDEINIARVEYYFAEFLSLLELPDSEDRKIRIISDQKDNDPKKLKNGEIKIPKNVWFIGTANNDDSTFAISDKVYDRAMIINLDKKAERFNVPDSQRVRISGEYFDKIVAHAVTECSITDRNRRRIMRLDEYLRKNLHVSFGNRIMRQLEKYVSVYIECGGNEIDAIDDIVSKKILRKLESQNPVYIKNALPGLYEFIDELYGENVLPRCREYLKRIELSV